MSETFPVTPEDRLSPDQTKERIHDVAKAQLVAKAMKPYEDESAAIRYVTEMAMTDDYKAGGEGEEADKIDFTDLETKLEDGLLSDNPLSKVQNWNEGLTALSDANVIDRNSNFATARGIQDEIRRNNRNSDNAADVVADTYDRLEATKR